MIVGYQYFYHKRTFLGSNSDGSFCYRDGTRGLSNKHQMPSTKFQIPNSKYQAPNPNIKNPKAFRPHIKNQHPASSYKINELNITIICYVVILYIPAIHARYYCEMLRHFRSCARHARMSFGNAASNVKSSRIPSGNCRI